MKVIFLDIDGVMSTNSCRIIGKLFTICERESPPL